MIFAELTNGLP